LKPTKDEASETALRETDPAAPRLAEPDYGDASERRAVIILGRRFGTSARR
jgi:hypothetical protein